MRCAIWVCCSLAAIGCKDSTVPQQDLDAGTADEGVVDVGGDLVADAAPDLADTTADVDIDGDTDASAPTCDAWRQGPTLTIQRVSSPTFLLPSAEVLFVGGHSLFVGNQPVLSSEIVDVAAGTAREVGSFNVTRTDPGPTTMLSDGRILSGSHWSFADPVPTEIFDIGTQSWTVLGNQIAPTGAIVPLDDGGALVAGGIAWDTETVLDRVERWDPTTQSWELTAPMSTPRLRHLLARVGSLVLAAGGVDTYPGGAAMDTYELYDPETDTWSAPQQMAMPQSGAPHIVLADGSVLVAAGAPVSGTVSEVTTSVQSYEPTTDTWAVRSSMSTGRWGHSISQLRDGRVVVAGGGLPGGSSINDVEIYDPATDAWTAGPPLAIARRLHSAVVLQSGELFVAGGFPAPGFITTEIFRPCEPP